MYAIRICILEFACEYNTWKILNFFVLYIRKITYTILKRLIIYKYLHIHTSNVCSRDDEMMMRWRTTTKHIYVYVQYIMQVLYYKTYIWERMNLFTLTCAWSIRCAIHNWGYKRRFNYGMGTIKREHFNFYTL